MASLPSYAKMRHQGFAEQRESALLRTDMESGPPRQAKVKSRVLVTRQVVIDIDSGTNYAAFKTWFGTTINEGADWFEWTDPVDGVLKQARFAGGGFSGAPVSTSVAGKWLLRASIETWG